MNWSILFVLAVVSGLFLWLSSKFFGKNGLQCFALLNFALCLAVGYEMGSADVLGVAVPIVLIHLLTVIFIFYIFYKKYTFKEVLKLVIINICFTVALGLVSILYLVYGFDNFTFAYDFALAPMIVLLGSFLAAIIVGFLIDAKINFPKEFGHRDLVAFLAAMLTAILIFNVAYFAGVLSFGSILLSLLISFLVAVIFGGVLFMLEKFFIVQSEKAGTKLVQTAQKPKIKSIPLNKTKSKKSSEKKEVFEILDNSENLDDESEKEED